jgi:hypothetical protein
MEKTSKSLQAASPQLLAVPPQALPPQPKKVDSKGTKINFYHDIHIVLENLDKKIAQEINLELKKCLQSMKKDALSLQRIFDELKSQKSIVKQNTRSMGALVFPKTSQEFDTMMKHLDEKIKLFEESHQKLSELDSEFAKSFNDFLSDISNSNTNGHLQRDIGDILQDCVVDTTLDSNAIKRYKAIANQHQKITSTVNFNSKESIKKHIDALMDLRKQNESYSRRTSSLKYLQSCITQDIDFTCSIFELLLDESPNTEKYNDQKINPTPLKADKIQSEFDFLIRQTDAYINQEHIPSELKEKLEQHKLKLTTRKNEFTDNNKTKSLMEINEQSNINLCGIMFDQISGEKELFANTTSLRDKEKLKMHIHYMHDFVFFIKKTHQSIPPEYIRFLREKYASIRNTPVDGLPFMHKAKLLDLKKSIGEIIKPHQSLSPNLPTPALASRIPPLTPQALTPNAYLKNRSALAPNKQRSISPTQGNTRQPSSGLKDKKLDELGILMDNIKTIKEKKSSIESVEQLNALEKEMNTMSKKLGDYNSALQGMPKEVEITQLKNLTRDVMINFNKTRNTLMSEFIDKKTEELGPLLNDMQAINFEIKSYTNGDTDNLEKNMDAIENRLQAYASSIKNIPLTNPKAKELQELTQAFIENLNNSRSKLNDLIFQNFQNKLSNGNFSRK